MGELPFDIELRLRYLEEEVRRLTREQVLEAELHALAGETNVHLDRLRAVVESRYTILSNQNTFIMNRLDGISVIISNSETMQREILNLVRRQTADIIARLEALERGGTTQS